MIFGEYQIRIKEKNNEFKGFNIKPELTNHDEWLSLISVQDSGAIGYHNPPLLYLKIDRGEYFVMLGRRLPDEFKLKINGKSSIDLPTINQINLISITWNKTLLIYELIRVKARLEIIGSRQTYASKKFFLFVTRTGSYGYLPTDREINVGREESNNLIIKLETVSKTHLRIKYESGACIVKTLDTTCSTGFLHGGFLNNFLGLGNFKEVGPIQQIPISHNDQLKIPFYSNKKEFLTLRFLLPPSK